MNETEKTEIKEIEKETKPSRSSAKTKKKPTFEESLARLEEIVRLLESGNAPLDSSLALFEEGVSLVRDCGALLDQAEQKVTLLTGDTPSRPASENDAF